MRCAVLLCLGVSALSGAILDRLAIAIDQRVITEAQLDEEIRVTAFLNQERIKREAESRHDVAD